MEANRDRDPQANAAESLRAEYDRRMGEIQRRFEASGDGLACTVARTSLVDEIVLRLWAAEVRAEPQLARGVALFATGGYGRGNLYPYSDIDLLICVEKGQLKLAQDPIRRVSQGLWDCGLEAALATRQPGDCEKFEATNPEFTLSLLDLRTLGGDPAVIEKLEQRTDARRWMKEAKTIGAELMALTRERHAKFGNTLFHLEPNIKDCLGGLRDANVCHWLVKLRAGAGGNGGESDELMEGVTFLAAVRCFLHYRRRRDDNVLDWRSQDAAAEVGVGLGRPRSVDTAYWMRAYFRHARLIQRRLEREIEASGLRLEEKPAKKIKPKGGEGFRVGTGQIELEKATADSDPAARPAVVLAAFGAVAASGMRLSWASEERISDAIPVLSMELEEGPDLWKRLNAILVGRYAGEALRAMHALGVLELILPEFHGIDALVIRDAYHRYTVDEHTFVLIDTLHALADDPGPGAPDWRVKFRQMLRELHTPGVLYLAALMHDTGKGRAGDNHAAESARMTEGVLQRLALDTHDAGQVRRIIEVHLEMSAALRRDIFDAETVRTFAAKVQTHELLRMLTLFTYADISAVHPDAITPWKAENLWRLEMRAANQLDRAVDEVRVHTAGGAMWKTSEDRVTAVLALAKQNRPAVEAYLDGFPERYLQTRTPGEIIRHFALTQHFDKEPLPLEFHHGDPISEITLVTRDRPRLFAGIAAALAASGMNVVTADAFANAAGVVVDSFRFTDSFRTLALNPGERERFVDNLRKLIDDPVARETMLRSRGRGRRPAPRVRVETVVEFHDANPSQSTLMQVIAQDVPGLLRAISQTFSDLGYNVEVALIDTEGEMAIDVFYLTRSGAPLTDDAKQTLREALVAAIASNAEGTA
ncbi:UTP--GlnB (protein PII) uridylyltransferase, GlnD [Bryocella elongata]|uniref:Bifunctional uridylyltransferase/uridylyl-removing enzyme n=1 Tax=Bryocella elongata TaxID=863522 RepID=A0A1H5ZJU7_9BACT|nr:HD domain-containing protein [Bryocella elongata]SEG35917.1 UTP--GlnB (protein PII) uridylyltransferase, GlnD [Bryocella elongata]